jgi:sugar/nucleoside kinase (ribokinase family)
VASALIVGSIALDTVETPFGKVDEALGGAASYASCAASLFAPVRLIGVVGEDFPEAHLEALAGRGIDTAHVQRIEGGRSFRWHGRYEDDMSQAQTLDTQLNVFADFRPEIPVQYRGSEIVFLANIDPSLQSWVLEQAEGAQLSLADTMNFWIEGKHDQLLDVLQRVDVALVNDAEVRQLTGEAGLIAAGRKALSLGPRYVVIKKGVHGATLLSGDSCFSVPSYPLAEVRDPTGAGDSFAGGIAGFLAAAKDLSEPNMRRALAVGTVMASFACEDFSLRRLWRVTQDDVRKRYAELRESAQFGAL